MKTTKRVLIGIGVVAVGAALAAVAYFATTSRDVVVVGYMRIATHVPVLIAKDLQLLDTGRLKVSLEYYPDTPTLMRAVEQGRVDIGFQLTPEAVWRSAAEGNRYHIYYIAASTSESPLDGLLAVAPLSAASLKGKKIGHFPGATAEAMTKRIVEEAYGLKTPRDYELRPVAPPLQFTALLKVHEVDALFTYEPLVTMLVTAGARNELAGPVERYIVDPWYGGIGVFSHDLVVRRPVVAKEFQAATAAAFSEIARTPAVFAEYVARLQPGITKETAAHIPIPHYIVATTSAEIEALRVALEKQLDIYRELGILSEEGRHNVRIFGE